LTHRSRALDAAKQFILFTCEQFNFLEVEGRLARAGLTTETLANLTFRHYSSISNNIVKSFLICVNTRKVIMSANPKADPALLAVPAHAHGIGGADFFTVRVEQKLEVAQGVFWLQLAACDGAPLPSFTAGAHLTVETPRGGRRNYSLCGDPADTRRYQIAVKRDSGGRGGSISMADDVHSGQTLQVSPPRNNFELAEQASQFIFVAGGIGITPILSMMRRLRRLGSTFKLYYCTRDEKSTAFQEELRAEFEAETVVHHDRGDLAQALDLWPIFEKPLPAHVYCCGPKGLMDSVADMTGHWPSGTVHFESFGVDAKAFAANEPFTVRLQQSGVCVPVSADQRILEALRAGGVRVTSSCESGTCGSCKTGLVSGEVEHRDMVLSDDEKATSIMVCVSRARASSPELVLAL
jgi:phthalate 4,5-dioxygenase reductase subunit